MPTADAHSIMATTEDRDELQARIAALQNEVEVLRAANAQLSGTAGRRAGDLTAREVGLGMGEASYRLLAEHTDDLVSVQDAAGHRVYVSPSHLTVLGYRAEELVGQRLTSEVHPQDAPLLLQSIAQVNQEVGGSARTLCRLQHCDGSWRWVEAMVTAVQVAGQRGVLMVARDVTKLRLLEGQLHQAQKMEIIGRLAGGVAHDFNNLLVVISGCAELGSLALPSVHPVQSDLKEIQQAALRATALTRQLLTLARRQPGEPRPLDLNGLITDMARLLRRLVRENVQLVTALAPALHTTCVDPGQLEQVIMNLVVNAHDAMPQGGQLAVTTANVKLPAATMTNEPPAGDYVQLDISDTGTGMTPEVQRHLFRVFFSTKAPERGTGLGLWTCHEIVKQHHGYIDVNSAVGRGTCVRILLPAVSGTPDLSAQSGVAGRGSLGTETVLVVEDEQIVRELAARVLREHGYTVHEATDGAQALDLLEQGIVVSLVVTDLVMPMLDGSSLAAAVWERSPEVRVLFMSGYADSALDAKHLGPQAAFLQKPFTARTLVQQVRALLDR